MNTTELLTISAAIVPDRVAMIDRDRRVTYEQLQSRVNRLANALSSMGLRSGDDWLRGTAWRSESKSIGMGDFIEGVRNV